MSGRSLGAARAADYAPNEESGDRHKVYCEKNNDIAEFHCRRSIRTTCVAQENGVGKNDEILRNLGRHPRGLWRLLTVSRKGVAARRGSSHAPRGGTVPLYGATLLALALTACAHQPLTRSCITKQQYEQLKASEPPKVGSKLTGEADKDTRPLAGSALELRAWGHAMLDTLKICSTP